MAGKAVKSVAKAVGEYQYPWREKLAKYKDELSKGSPARWSNWEFDPERKEMRTKRKGHKVDRLAAEKRERTAELMEAMPQMLADYRKRRWERKMKAEDDAAKKALQE
ncbi:UNVERIFIED_CONTAM: hypothetical protein Sradi_3491100 [Sesamum radiatum]|uniref:MRPL25 domain-containing protein n=1 Tax=Sesamum radiatum TaxID=300843 RepID=A0AAW2QEJ8_SESRA